MRFLDQRLDDIVDALSPLDIDWMDDVASSAMVRITALPKKASYHLADIAALLDDNVEEGILCLGLSRDSMDSALRRELGAGGIGVKRYKTDRDAYLEALERLGLPEKMAAAVNYQPLWSDILQERLRSGRGSAIQGQKRGRGLEDFAEAIVKEIYGEAGYETRCTFTGADGKTAKCDLAIPDRRRPQLIIEVKGYGATGSKMTDIIGDLDAIIETKRHDAHLLFVTDGVIWKNRLSDLRKIVERQNQGKIACIYTSAMRDRFLGDLAALKAQGEGVARGE
jgi:hypothetical protein